jgi:hypothetical protein
MKSCQFRKVALLLAFLFLAGISGLADELKTERLAGTTAQNPGHKDKPGRSPRTWRAIAEETLLFGSSTIQYWSNYDNFSVDWQFTWKTFGRKFFTKESPRLDSNHFYFNWSHAWAGAGYYTMARANGFNNRLSFLFSLATSSIWESFVEWRELISINDVVFTSFGGPAIGEPLFQVSSYFSQKKGFWNSLAGFIFNPFLTLNNLIDHKHGSSSNSAPDPGWHRFMVYAGLQQDLVTPQGTGAVAQSGSWDRCFNLGLDLVTQTLAPEEPAKNVSGFYPDTLAAGFSLNFAFSRAGMEEIQVQTSAVLFGWNWPGPRHDSESINSGNSYFLGYGTAFEVFKKRSVAWYDQWYDNSNDVEADDQAGSAIGRLYRPTPTQFTDKLAVISPAGVVFVLSSYKPKLRLRWTSAGYADFAMVNSLPYNRFTANHDNSGVKTTLLNWGYYYAIGTTISSEIDVSCNQWRLAGLVSHQAYQSIQGLDRYQYLGLITEDFRLSDTRLRWRFLLGYRLHHTPIELGLTAEGISRRGWLPELTDHYAEHRYYYHLRFIF